MLKYHGGVNGNPDPKKKKEITNKKKKKQKVFKQARELSLRVNCDA